MFYGDINEKEIQKKGGICKHRADSLCFTAETNNIVKQLYSNKIYIKSNASFSKRSKNENATTFSLSLSLFFSLCGVATGLAATGLVGCKHYDVFWPLNPIHYGI